MNPVDTKPKSCSRFIGRGLEAIEDTKQLGNGLPAEWVLTMLDEKLRLARQMQLQTLQTRRAYYPID